MWLKFYYRSADHMSLTLLFFISLSKVTLERCLDTLNFINWDLQKAIKLCKMQNMNPEKTLQECFDELDPDWDLDLNSVTK